MKSEIFFYSLFLLLSTISSYPIEGEWKVTNIGSSEIPQELTITLNIADYVFRDKEVRWLMEFKSCKSFKYLFYVQQNQLFIDVDTFLLLEDDNQEQKQCSVEEETIDIFAASKMKQIFQFQIISSFMVLTNVKGDVIMKMVRYSNSGPVDLTGNWVIQILQSQRFAQTFQIDNNSFIFCQRKASIQYQLSNSKKHAITLSDFKDEGCGFNKLVVAVQKVAYYREIIRGTGAKRLQFYNDEDQLIIRLAYLTDLETARLQKLEQDKREAEQQAERIARLQELRILQLERIQRERNQTIMKIAIKLTNTIKDIEGQWEIVSVFRIPNFVPKLSILITSNNIVLSGGCNTHIVQYQQSVGEPQNIRIGNLRSGDQDCPVDDDGLFIAGLQKIQSYSVKIESQLVVAQFRDSAGSLVFQLKKPVQYQTIIVNPNPSPIPNPSISFPTFPSPRPPSVVPPFRLFSTNRAIVLLLKRRNIPRKFITVDNVNKSFTFTICNELEFSYIDEEQSNTLKVTLESKSFKGGNCNQSHQDAYISYFEGVTRFRFEDGSLYFGNEEEGDTISVNDS